MASATGANRVFYKEFALLSPQKIQPIERCHIGIKKSGRNCSVSVRSTRAVLSEAQFLT